MTSERVPVPIERLEEAVARLRPLEREALLLSARDHLGTDEIAERLGLDPDTARRLLARALRKLDRELEREDRPWWRFW